MTAWRWFRCASHRDRCAWAPARRAHALPSAVSLLLLLGAACGGRVDQSDEEGAAGGTGGSSLGLGGLGGLAGGDGGGVADAGEAAGGAGDAGESFGGVALGGRPVGGAPAGGQSSGGARTGGAPAGGDAGEGGEPMGGREPSTGGTPDPGSGGTPDGGTGATGGAPTGGAPAGGAPAGGGGTTGGAEPTGGRPGVGGGAGEGGEAGAAGAPAEPAVECVLAVPAALSELAGPSFFDHPWPSDFRRDAAGALAVEGFPNPQSSSLLAGYVTLVDGVVEGFSLAAAGYLRFTGAIDAGSLPRDPLAARDPASSVQLVDVDPASAHRGERQLVTLALHPVADGYFADDTLAFQPTPGFPLRPGTRYALLVTDALRARAGAVGACPELRQVLGLEPASGPTAALQEDWADAVATLERDAGLRRESLVHLTVFTTDDPTRPARELRDAVRAGYPAPAVDALALLEERAALDVYEGSYGPSPDYQAGTPPFLLAGGGIDRDAGGAPIVARELELRFLLTVPDAAACPAPAAGYPVALYAHGTGGDYHSALDDGTAERLAAECVATFTIDQIFHGTRPGGPCSARGNVQPCNLLNDEAMAVFNTLNPTSMRHTNLQATVDLVQQARLVTTGALAVPAAVSATGARIAFDPARVILRAHSQGAVNGVLALAVDDQLAGAALSGAAAMVSLSLLGRQQPEDLGVLLADQLYGAGSGVTVTLDHPALSLLQTALDVSDPSSFGRLVVTEPPEGFPPRSVLMVEGVGADGQSDGFVSSHAIEVNALAMGLPALLPLVAPIAELAWGGPEAVSLPEGGLARNLADGRATGALVQFAPPANADPHFVVFDVEAAAAQTAAFIGSLATDGVGRIE